MMTLHKYSYKLIHKKIESKVNIIILSELFLQEIYFIKSKLFYNHRRLTSWFFKSIFKNVRTFLEL